MNQPEAGLVNPIMTVYHGAEGPMVVFTGHDIVSFRRDDIVSLVAYDTTVQVLIPATRLTDRSTVYAAIERLAAEHDVPIAGGRFEDSIAALRAVERRLAEPALAVAAVVGGREALARRGAAPPRRDAGARAEPAGGAAAARGVDDRLRHVKFRRGIRLGRA